MVLFGVLNQDEAIRGINFNAIGLLTGMMVLVSVGRRCGIFEFLAVWAAKIARAQPWAILAMLSTLTAVVSAFLDNVTTVLLIAPVTLEISRHLEVPPYPFLFAEVFASNIGGTATLIGDPPNILIGTAANLSFNDFVANLTPVIALVMVAQLIATHLIWGRRMRASTVARQLVMALETRGLIVDPSLALYVLLVMAAVVVAFVFAQDLGLQPATIALLGAAVLMLLHNIEHHGEHEKQTARVTETFNEVDWITIFFFLGLFVIVHGIEVTCIPAMAAQRLIGLTGQNAEAAVTAVLWGSALLSAIVDNIPFVAAMIPVIREFGSHLGSLPQMSPLWWALSLGACLGGNGTLIGASANIAVAGIAERNGIDFRFITYTKHAFALMVINITISNLYLWLRYF